MQTLEELLQEAVGFHGHLCPGQVLGVRMALAGCRAVNVVDPKGTRELIVYVEIDRCAADAIQSVTGCRLGKRTLKHVDYGKMAATFVNVATGRAVRILAKESSRDLARLYAPHSMTKSEAQLQAYQVMPEEELFAVSPVRLQTPEEDLPGHPLSRVICEGCGEGVNDRREVKQDGRTLCRACGAGAYYKTVDPIYTI